MIDVPPIWTTAPFVLLLLAVAIMPLIAPHWWHPNRNKGIVAAALGAPIAIWVGLTDLVRLGHAMHEYVAFILLLTTLYIIAGGIVVRGAPAGTPGLNTAMLAIGTAIASFVGTTGASMLLIRPVLRANRARKRRAHIIVFFIFLVSNVGGLLTPLGDPPLFLGFLRGVPFTWTLRLAPEWLSMSALLLLVFYIVDSTVFRREDLATPGDLDEKAVASAERLRIDGAHNFLFLLGVVLLVLASGTYELPLGAQELGLASLAVGSILTTRKQLRADNQFTWAPIVEVAVLFAGIFATMIPALQILGARGPELGLSEPWHYFWATGLLSSFLDNAPTYLTFASTASGFAGSNPEDLATLLAANAPNGVSGEALLVGVSLGAVLMGANTYVGNGPNFMVKAIAEEDGVTMPSFGGYMLWSGAVLLPLFALLTVLFL